MKNMLLAFVIALLFVEHMAMAVETESPGIVIAAEGTVQAQSATGIMRKLTLRSKIYVGDKITTGTGSVVQFLMIDDTIIAQGSNGELLLSKYAYTAAGDAECDLTIKEGAVRVVTGEIPKLNPEKFNVHMNLASVEVQGCSMAFESRGGKNKIHILGLGKKEKVVVHRHLGDADGGSLQNSDYKKDGVTIFLEDGKHTKVSKTDANDLTSLLSSFQSSKHKDSGLAKGLEIGRGEGHNRHDHGGHENDTGRGHERDHDDDNGDVIDPPSIPETPPPPEIDIETPPPPPPPPVVNDDDGTETPQSEYTVSGTGTDWEWGTWATDGELDRVDVSSSTIISEAAFQAIADGATRFDLTGNGDAAAAISHNGDRSLVEGTCALNVTVGDAVVPSWDAVISAGNAAGDALNFEADGTIHRDGTMEGNQLSYSLNVGGSSYNRGSITDESISGNLVGPGTGATPVTGAIGDYNFKHGTDAEVNGIFGTDLN